MNWTMMIGSSVLSVAVVACGGQPPMEERAPEPEPAPADTARSFPTFEVDADWPQLPNGWITGEVSSVAVDRRDHIWVLQRPHTIAEEDRDNAAPPLIEFDDTGVFVAAWGGQDDGYDWPWNEHGLFVDHNGHVWIGGNNPTGRTPQSDVEDNMILKFTNQGEFLMQIGGRNLGTMNLDTNAVRKAAEMFVYEPTNEVLVADGYGNRRVIVFDADTGEFKRMWAAFGEEPSDTEPEADPDSENGPPWFGTVHGVEVSNDGLVYVGRPQQQSDPDLRSGWQLPASSIRESVRGPVADGGGSRVLSRSRTDFLIRRRPGEPAHSRPRPSDARGAGHLGRVREGTGELRRVASHRGRQQGQPLHGGSPAQPPDAAVPLHRDVAVRTAGFRERFAPASVVDGG